MNAHVEIEAGICGFTTTVDACANEDQEVTFSIATPCAKVRQLADAIESAGAIDAYEELMQSSVILGNACVRSCCAGCIVPHGIFKSMQIAAGLALPKDVVLRMSCAK